jgi:hypothetical protein
MRTVALSRLRAAAGAGNSKLPAAMDGVYIFADGSQLTLAEMIDRRLAREYDSIAADARRIVGLREQRRKGAEQSGRRFGQHPRGSRYLAPPQAGGPGLRRYTLPDGRLTKPGIGQGFRGLPDKRRNRADCAATEVDRSPQGQQLSIFWPELSSGRTRQRPPRWHEAEDRQHRHPGRASAG